SWLIKSADSNPGDLIVNRLFAACFIFLSKQDSGPIRGILLPETRDLPLRFAVHPATPLTELDWIPLPRRRQLERVGITTVEGLLTHFPKRYEDRSRFDHFPSGDSERPVCVCGLVKKTKVVRIRGWQKMFDAVLEEENAHALS